MSDLLCSFGLHHKHKGCASFFSEFQSFFSLFKTETLHIGPEQVIGIEGLEAKGKKLATFMQK